MSTTAVDPLPGAAEPARRSIGVERAAWTFYVVAAIGSSIGQIWVAVQNPPWPAAVPIWARALMVAPFAVVIDLGGAVASAFADSRRRLGEAAYGWRILSAGAVTLAVGINIVGHAGSPYLATLFGGLGVFAYTVWLLHSAARRRDALRTAGKLRPPAASFGLLQWLREPGTTWRARTLSADHGYGRVESLAAARTQLADETRRAALASHIEAKIRARHEHDPILASIAATTTPIDQVAQELIDLIDAHGWAQIINAEIQPPVAAIPVAPALPLLPIIPAPLREHDQQAPDDVSAPGDETPLTNDVPTDDPAEPGNAIGPDNAIEADEYVQLDDEEPDDTDELSDVPADLAAILPTKPAAYQRYRAMWIDISERPDDTNKKLADDLDTSTRTVQRVRAVGAAGLLESPQPPPARLLRLAVNNGVPQPEFTS